MNNQDKEAERTSLIYGYLLDNDISEAEAARMADEELARQEQVARLLLRLVSRNIEGGSAK